MKWLYGLALGICGGFALGSLLGPKPASTLRGLAGSLSAAGRAAGAAVPSRASGGMLSGLMEDERITRAVHERLLDRGIDNPRVDVTTVDGTVYLRGRVASADEQRAIAGVARDTPGVQAVVDELKVPESAPADPA